MSFSDLYGGIRFNPREKRSQEILAWRGWRIGSPKECTEPTLLSFNKTPWHGPSLAADVVPKETNANGIYALKQKPYPGHGNSDYFRHEAYGVVALSGIVVEGDQGYRAQRATIRQLTLRSPLCTWEWGQLCRCDIKRLFEEKYQAEVAIETEEHGNLPVPDEDGVALVKYGGQIYKVLLRSIELRASVDDFPLFGRQGNYQVRTRPETVTFEGYLDRG